MLTEVKIANIDVTSKLMTWKIVETFGQTIKECTITLSKSVVPDVISEIDISNAVTIKRGEASATEQFKFNGYVDEIDKTGSTYVIRCKDKLIDLQRATVTYSYDSGIDPSAGVGSEIAKDLIETWGGMTAEVVSTGATNLIKKFICKGVDVFERVVKLAEIYDYQVYYNPDDDKVHFEPKGYTVSGTIIYVGGANNNAANIPVWKQDSSSMFNRITVKGATQLVNDTEFFNGSGAASQNFVLAKVPVTVEVWEDIAGTWYLKVAGIEDQIDTNFDYYVDKPNKNIVCTTNWTPASGSNNIRIIYSNSIPVPVQVEDDPSIAQYGLVHTERIYTDIESINDAEQRGRGLLSIYATPFITTTIKVAGEVDYEAGQKVQVIDTYSDENRQVVINKITYEYPHSADKLEVGDEEWRVADWGAETVQRVRRLEEQIQDNIETLTTIKDFSAEIKVLPRYLRGVSTNIGDTFIVGHPVNSIIGDSAVGVGGGDIVIGEDAIGSDEDVRVIHPNNKYKEDFHDNDFEDTSSTTANWDTSAKQVSYS